MRIAILGYGAEGKSAESFLRKKLPKAKIEIRDQKKQGVTYLHDLKDFDLIVRSPGIPFLSPEIQAAKRQGIEVSSVTNLFFRHAQGAIIGVTGTKGKGTTCTMLFDILKAAKKNVVLAGNIGIPMIDVLPKLKKNSIVILELSSFQLQDLTVGPDIAVILTINPDHLDHHKTFEEYVDAKSGLTRHQPKTGRTYFYADDAWSKAIANASYGKKIAVKVASSALLKPTDLVVPGKHNFQNAVMAARVAADLGISPSAIKKALHAFRGREHRLEFVRESHGIQFYNDSAGTNPVATAAALRAFSKPIIWLAGGKDKGFDYTDLRKPFQTSTATMAILYGDNRRTIQKAIGRGKPVHLVKDLKEAFAIAMQHAKPNSVVLLSPASASFDQFKNYSERGDLFKRLSKAVT